MPESVLLWCWRLSNRLQRQQAKQVEHHTQHPQLADAPDSPPQDIQRRGTVTSSLIDSSPHEAKSPHPAATDQQSTNRREHNLSHGRIQRKRLSGDEDISTAGCGGEELLLKVGPDLGKKNSSRGSKNPNRRQKLTYPSVTAVSAVNRNQRAPAQQQQRKENRRQSSGSKIGIGSPTSCRRRNKDKGSPSSTAAKDNSAPEQPGSVAKVGKKDPSVSAAETSGGGRGLRQTLVAGLVAGGFPFNLRRTLTGITTGAANGRPSGSGRRSAEEEKEEEREALRQFEKELARVLRKGGPASFQAPGRSVDRDPGDDCEGGEYNESVSDDRHEDRSLLLGAGAAGSSETTTTGREQEEEDDEDDAEEERRWFQSVRASKRDQEVLLDYGSLTGEGNLRRRLLRQQSSSASGGGRGIGHEASSLQRRSAADLYRRRSLHFTTLNNASSGCVTSGLPIDLHHPQQHPHHHHRHQCCAETDQWLEERLAAAAASSSSAIINIEHPQQQRRYFDSGFAAQETFTEDHSQERHPSRHSSLHYLREKNYSHYPERTDQSSGTPDAISLHGGQSDIAFDCGNHHSVEVSTRFGSLRRSSRGRQSSNEHSTSCWYLTTDHEDYLGAEDRGEEDDDDDDEEEEEEDSGVGEGDLVEDGVGGSGGGPLAFAALAAEGNRRQRGLRHTHTHGQQQVSESTARESGGYSSSAVNHRRSLCSGSYQEVQEHHLEAQEAGARIEPQQLSQRSQVSGRAEAAVVDSESGEEDDAENSPGVYESIITLDPFEMISMARQVHIVANPMQDPLYSTIGEISERVYECPDTPPPPVPPKQMEVLYTKPTKKTNGGAAFKIYKSRENVPLSPTRDSSSSSSSQQQQGRELADENLTLKQEILAYRDRVRALAGKLEQFDTITHIVEDLQAKVEKVSQENARLRHYETEHREISEQVKEAQRQYKLDVDQLSSQVALLDNERCELEQSLNKLQREHDCLMISSQNSVSFQYHSQAMLEVKRLLEELKNKYQNDKESLLQKADAADEEKEKLLSKISQLEEELETLRGERDSLSAGYRKVVRQNQTLVTHIKELESEDTEIHALMQTLIQSAHQAVAERDTLERMVVTSQGSTPHLHQQTINGNAPAHNQTSTAGSSPPPATTAQSTTTTVAPQSTSMMNGSHPQPPQPQPRKQSIPGSPPRTPKAPKTPVHQQHQNSNGTANQQLSSSVHSHIQTTPIPPSQMVILGGPASNNPAVTTAVGNSALPGSGIVGSQGPLHHHHHHLHTAAGGGMQSSTPQPQSQQVWLSSKSAPNSAAAPSGGVGSSQSTNLSSSNSTDSPSFLSC